MSKRKLLLADDSITIQKVVNLTFAGEGIEVIAVGDGNSAIDKLREDNPDLVLADVNMPGLNGYEICEKIKGSNKNTPVILLVGSFEPFDEDEAKRVGADDYLTKPFQSISQLVSKVTDLLDSEKNSSANNNSSADSENQSSETREFARFDDSTIDDEMIQADQIGSLPADEASKYETQENNEVELTAFAETSDIEELTNESYQYGEDSDKISLEDKQEFIDTQEMELQNQTEENKSEENIQEKESDLPVPEAVSVLDLDEMNLLELPPLDDYDEDFDVEDEEFEEIDLDESQDEQPSAETTNDEIVSPFTSTKTFDEPKEESEQEEESEPEEESENAADEKLIENDFSESEFTGEKISSDLVEAIADRVVEKLSDKVIREIAWEVVPQMADLIIKKMAEEKVKN